MKPTEEGPNGSDVGLYAYGCETAPGRWYVRMSAPLRPSLKVQYEVPDREHIEVTKSIREVVFVEVVAEVSQHSAIPLNRCGGFTLTPVVSLEVPSQPF